MTGDLDDDMASSLQRLRGSVAGVEDIAEEEAWAAAAGGFDQATWIADVVRHGLEDVELLRRGSGRDWLARQPETVQREVADAERYLQRALAHAVADGATALPGDPPVAS
jgi:hypothetical protein